MNTVSEWIIYARKFIATGLPEFLAKAIEVCEDIIIREYLTRIRDAGHGLIEPYPVYTLAYQLRSSKRLYESAIVQILGINSYVSVAAYPEMTNGITGKYAEMLCHQAAYISHEYDFTETEAFFLANLGMRESKLRNWENARKLIEKSLHLYKMIAKSEPVYYRQDMVKSLSNLGNILSRQKKFALAEDTLMNAVSLYRELEKTQQDLYKPNLAVVLYNLGNVFSEQRKFSESLKMYEEALGIQRELEKLDTAKYLPGIAMTLNAVGNVLCMQRRFLESNDAYEEALGIWRTLVKEEPDLHLPQVAMTLNNLGIVLREVDMSDNAQKYLEESLDIRRQLANKNPQTFKPLVAETLTNLGNLLFKDQKLAEAKRVFQEALEIRRKLIDKEPEAYEPYLADSLNNLGNVLQAENNFLEAVRAFKEALEIRQKLAENYPQTFLPFVAGTLNNLSHLYNEMGLEDKSISAARKAVHCAESKNIPLQSMFLAKGWAMGAYTRILSSLVEKKDTGGVFRCLAAMREGNVRAFGEKSETVLENAACELQKITEYTGRDICIVIIQQLTPVSVFFGVMKSTLESKFIYEQTNAIIDSSEKLYRHIQDVFSLNPQNIETPPYHILIKLGGALWNVLPGFVREAFHPNNNHEVLISADSYWSTFPWEALHFGDEDFNFLGLHMPLVRWSPITAQSLGKIRNCWSGQGKLSAAVICPWNVPNKAELQGAKNEASEVAKLLSSMGCEFTTPESIAIGKDASIQAFSRILEKNPSIIHYTGHGGVVKNEEVLFLWDSILKTPAVFGRKELLELALKPGLEGKLLKNGSLVVLNSCWSGRIRDYGGHREDLTWAFLQEGAEAVIANPMPVSDDMGIIFGTELYKSCEGNSMAGSFIHARRKVEEKFRDNPLLWRAWTLLHYYGNPYAILSYFLARK